MKRFWWAMALLLLLPNLASAPVAAAASETAAAQQQFFDWLDHTRTFIGGTTFDEGDVQSLIRLWPEFTSIADEDEREEEVIDYETVLQDQRYRSFAARHGVAARPWLQKSMRIVMMMMKGEMATHLAAAEAQMPQQLEMIKGQKEQFGEEAYQQMKQALEAGAVMLRQQRQAWAAMPEPTASESALLEKHRDELRSLMMGDEERGDRP